MKGEASKAHSAPASPPQLLVGLGSARRRPVLRPARCRWRGGGRPRGTSWAVPCRSRCMQAHAHARRPPDRGDVTHAPPRPREERPSPCTLPAPPLRGYLFSFDPF